VAGGVEERTEVHGWCEIIIIRVSAVVCRHSSIIDLLLLLLTTTTWVGRPATALPWNSVAIATGRGASTAQRMDGWME